MTIERARREKTERVIVPVRLKPQCWCNAKNHIVFFVAVSLENVVVIFRPEGEAGIEDKPAKRGPERLLSASFCDHPANHRQAK